MNKTEKYLKKLIDEMPEYCKNLQEATEKNDNTIFPCIKSKKHFSLKYSVAAICLLLIIVSTPVMARIPFIAERMQTVSEEEVKELSDMTNQQNIDADIFSRPLTEDERTRMQSLKEAYENGSFPDEDICLVSQNTEIDAAVDFYYNIDTGMFYLPDSRELTDEEIKQLIDFYYKRDYSLQKQAVTEDAETGNVKNNGLVNDVKIPGSHKEIIGDWLMIFDIYDYEPGDLQIEEVSFNDWGDMYLYAYESSDGTFHFTIQDGALTYLDKTEDKSDDVSVDVNKMEPVSGTKNYTSIKADLEKLIMKNGECAAVSSWFICKTDLEGCPLKHSYAYVFEFENGEMWIVNYKYGSAYPYMIRVAPLSYFETIEKGKKLQEEKGILTEVVPLDIETGKCLPD